jgi:hypothetical protein
VITIRTTIKAPCGIDDAFPSPFLAKKNRVHRQTSWTYMPTKTWLIALGKNLPPVSADTGSSYTHMKRYLYTTPDRTKKRAPKPLMIGEMTMYAMAAISDAY